MARVRRSRSKKKQKVTARLADVSEDTRVIVEIRDSRADTWSAPVESHVLSRFGASFYLKRACNVGQLARLRFPSSIAKDFFGRGGQPLALVCLIQQSNRVIVDGEPRFHVSAAFVGEQFPESYHVDPSRTYAVCGTDESGFFKIAESEKPFRPRRHPRFLLQLEISLIHINQTDKTVVRALGFTKNVSVSGLSVVSTLEAQIGDKIKVGSPDLDFYSVAVVRNRRSLIGLENLLHLEFLDFPFPARRVMSVVENQKEDTEYMEFTTS